MSKRVELPELEARRWDGDEWPGKRISIATVDPSGGPGHALFINARYADLDQAQWQANEIARRCNVHDELVEALEEMSRTINHAFAGRPVRNADEIIARAEKLLEAER